MEIKFNAFDPSPSGSGKKRVKRARVSTSCTSCKKKKIKCDKQKPCGNCVRGHGQKECDYEEFRWANLTVDDQVGLDKDAALEAQTGPKPETDDKSKQLYIELLEKEIAALKKQVADADREALEAKKNAELEQKSGTINLYDGFNPLQMNSGKVTNQNPFHWSVFSKKDRFLKVNAHLFLLAQTRVIQNGDAWRELPNSLKLDKRAIWKPEEIHFVSFFNPTDFKTSNLNALSDTLENADKIQFMKTRKSVPEVQEPSLPQSLIQNNAVDSNRLIKKCLLAMLPQKKVVWLCVDRFFKYCFPFMPYVDQEEFLATVVRILGPESRDEAYFREAKIVSRMDYASLVLLLLTVLLGYLSLTGCSKSECSEDEQYLLDHPVSLDIARAVQNCLFEWRLFNSTSLPVLQCTLLFRLYERFAPENGEFHEPVSQILNGMLVQMAITLGLNRDPENIMLDSPERKKFFDLRRRIWYCIKAFDGYQDFVLGSASTAGAEFYDTNIPQAPTQKTKQHSCLKLDKASWGALKKQIELDSMLRTLDPFLHIKRRDKVSALVKATDDIEKCVRREYGSICEICMRQTSVKDPERLVDDFQKASDLINYFHAMSVCHVVWYHLMLHAEVSGDSESAVKYMKRAIRIGVELTETIPNIVEHCNVAVGQGFQYAVIPMMEFALHKTKLLEVAMWIRCHHLAAKCVEDGRMTMSMKHTITMCIKHLLNALNATLVPINRLAEKYFYAWKMGKMHLVFSSVNEQSAGESEYLFYYYADAATGQRRLKLRGDPNNIIQVPEHSTISNFNEAQLKEYYEFHLECSRKARSPEFLEKFAQSWEHDPDNLRAGIPHDLLGYLTSKEVDAIWGSFTETQVARSADDSDQIFQMQPPAPLTPLSAASSTYQAQPGLLSAMSEESWWSHLFNEMGNTNLDLGAPDFFPQ